MQLQSYSDVLEDAQLDARQVEAGALDRAVALLGYATQSTAAGIEALDFTRGLWMALMNDLSDPENALPDPLKANLISIGIWIIREAEAIRLGSSTNYSGIAEVCGLIRDGLQRRH